MEIAPTKGSGDQLERKVVLVVGADESVTATVKEELPNWEVQKVDTNSNALELLRQKSYDLVLTGDKTAGKEDVELLRQIRTVRPHTRLIILTNQSTPADVIAAMRDRAFSYFSQPYSTADFRQMLFLAVTGPAWDEGIEIVTATPKLIRLIARCDLKTADRVLQFIHEVSDFPAPEKEAVGTAFREVLTNAMEHGAHFDPSQHVEVAYIRSKRAVACRVKDPGHGFSLDELRRSALGNPPDEPLRHLDVRKKEGLRAGGFGILLAKNVIDELIYGESGNEVILIKYLDGNKNTAEPAKTKIDNSA